MENVIAAIDIGSSKIKTVIWNFEKDSESWSTSFNIIGVWISQSNAIRKWNILDMEEFKANLEDSLLEAEKMAWEHMVWAYISFNSPSFEVIDNKWVIAVTWTEVTTSDVERVLDMTKTWVELPNRTVLKVIPDTFTVDIEEGIKSPIGMSARKLEARTNIFTGSTNIIWNFKKAIEDIWVEIYDIYPNLISSAEWVLTKRQKEIWCVVIDIWASSTWVTVYEDGSLKYSKILPVWGDLVTNDIALWCRTSIDIAEKLKLEFWAIDLFKDEDKEDKEIDLSKYSDSEDGTVSEKYLSEIITARYDEIIYFVKSELKKAWRDWMLAEWAILVWGASKVKGLSPMIKEQLRLPVTIGLPLEKSTITEASISDPVFSPVVWTMMLAHKYSIPNSSFKISLDMASIMESLKNLLKKILP